MEYVIYVPIAKPKLAARVIEQLTKDGWQTSGFVGLRDSLKNIITVQVLTKAIVEAK